MQQIIAELEAADVGTIRPDEPLAKYTTWEIGGPADVLVIPDNKQQLIRLIRLLYLHGVPWTKIGRGSNLLVSDRGIRGVVIKLGKELDYCRFDDNLVYAGASYSLIKLCTMAGKQGLTGLEFAGGIPGSVGGAVYMNAGAHGSDVSRILKSVEVLLENGEVVHWSNEDMQYAYRHSVLHEQNGIVLEAVFELAHGDRNEIIETSASFKARRLRTQPLTLASAGSVFRNPPENFAAKLIEEAGLKGLRVGGAEVSPMHANFIINTGHATARDVLTLIERIRQTVQEQFGVDLTPEVLVVGER